MPLAKELSPSGFKPSPSELHLHLGLSVSQVRGLWRDCGEAWGLSGPNLHFELPRRAREALPLSIPDATSPQIDHLSQGP